MSLLYEHSGKKKCSLIKYLQMTLRGEPAKLSIYIWVWPFPSPDSSASGQTTGKGSKKVLSEGPMKYCLGDEVFLEEALLNLQAVAPHQRGRSLL
ncbi:hypothetical protein EYF80_015176 [Liparis tanakae]|uniref:Uncharacterized protein n=1 Tax=Liparis tanakae TaxID=230148 RepID=A0A4Z2I974_9TELE|nr:hypothetical protein EYF80_015176 [Liparis tanakae]